MYVRVDGYAYVYGELVDGFEDEDVAGEREGVEVALFVVEDDVEDAGLAEVKEVGGEVAGESEERSVEHLAQGDGEDLGDHGVGADAGELAQGFAQAELYGVGLVAYDGAGLREVGLGERLDLPYRHFGVLDAALVDGLLGVDDPGPQSAVESAAKDHLLVRFGRSAEDAPSVDVASGQAVGICDLGQAEGILVRREQRRGGPAPTA